jgi:DNA-binding response OmpR family regulator
MEKLLRKHGYNSIAASNAKGAIKKTIEEKPDAVLLDVMMGDPDGWDVCKDLKNNPETKNTPIIMCTVMAEDESIKRSFERGADWHVSKPFDIDLFFSILKLASERAGKTEIEDKINQIIEREKSMKKVLEMINPKLIDHNYDFLEK